MTLAVIKSKLLATEGLTLPYTYKFSRDVILRFLWSTGHLQNFHPQNFIGETLACINWRAGYLVILENDIVKMLDL